jgi:hypothetical protein
VGLPRLHREREHSFQDGELAIDFSVAGDRLLPLRDECIDDVGGDFVQAHSAEVRREVLLETTFHVLDRSTVVAAVVVEDELRRVVECESCGRRIVEAAKGSPSRFRKQR